MTTKAKDWEHKYTPATHAGIRLRMKAQEMPSQGTDGWAETRSLGYLIAKALLTTGRTSPTKKGPGPCTWVPAEPHTCCAGVVPEVLCTDPMVPIDAASSAVTEQQGAAYGSCFPSPQPSSHNPQHLGSSPTRTFLTPAQDAWFLRMQCVLIKA